VSEAATSGLRARKKERTRRLIADTAQALFRERGFDRVTVAEIAVAADVSEGTVFNYFPAKEDLFWSGMDVFEARLVEEVAARPEGEGVLDAFRRVVLDGVPRLADPSRAVVIAAARTTIQASEGLRSREREIVARHTADLADVIAADTGARPHDPEPLAAAAALMGAQRALVAFVHERVAAGESGPKLAAAARAQVRRVFSLLGDGLDGYAVRQRNGGRAARTTPPAPT
jgi:AcrR family transcriptional regulator